MTKQLTLICEAKLVTEKAGNESGLDTRLGKGSNRDL